MTKPYIFQTDVTKKYMLTQPWCSYKMISTLQFDKWQCCTCAYGGTVHDSASILLAFIFHQNMDIAELIMIYRLNKVIFLITNFHGTKYPS